MDEDSALLGAACATQPTNNPGSGHQPPTQPDGKGPGLHGKPSSQARQPSQDDSSPAIIEISTSLFICSSRSDNPSALLPTCFPRGRVNKMKWQIAWTMPTQSVACYSILAFRHSTILDPIGKKKKKKKSRGRRRKNRTKGGKKERK